jgi:hypothetical protein
MSAPGLSRCSVVKILHVFAPSWLNLPAAAPMIRNNPNEPNSAQFITNKRPQITPNNPTITTITEPKIKLGGRRAILRSAVGVTHPGPLAQSPLGQVLVRISACP